MRVITPEPWIGPKFGADPFVSSVLVVGDSHYGDAEDDDFISLTQNVIKSRKDNLDHTSFFSVIEQIIIGRKPLISEVAKFWDQMAFVNYAPRLVMEGKSANAVHFAGAQERLKGIVETIEPDVICFFSATAWERRPWGGPDWSKEVFGMEPIDVSKSLTLYPFKRRKIVAARFNHPRALGAPIDVWHNWYREVIRLAEDVRVLRR